MKRGISAVLALAFGAAAYGIAIGAEQPQHSGAERPADFAYAVPVEIGGDNSAANLWPMPVSADVADRKNALAVRLHDLVCAGTVPLGTAQQDAATDWYAAYVAAGRPHGSGTSS